MFIVWRMSIRLLLHIFSGILGNFALKISLQLAVIFRLLH